VTHISAVASCVLDASFDACRVALTALRVGLCVCVATAKCLREHRRRRRRAPDSVASLHLHRPAEHRQPVPLWRRGCCWPAPSRHVLRVLLLRWAYRTCART
jgi:hypothetical protein